MTFLMDKQQHPVPRVDHIVIQAMNFFPSGGVHIYFQEELSARVRVNINKEKK